MVLRTVLCESLATRCLSYLGRVTYPSWTCRSTEVQISRHAWKAQWDAYISLSGLADQPQSKQVQALTLCFSRETVTIVDNLGLSVADRNDAGKIVNAIQSYVAGQINESVERRNFRSCF